MNSEKKIDHCPRCNRRKSARFILCRQCEFLRVKEAKKLAKLARKSQRALARNEKALKKMTKLPAKNRKKSAIVEALLSGSTAESLLEQRKSRPATEGPKTVRYQSLENALRAQLLRKLEEF